MKHFSKFVILLLFLSNPFMHLTAKIPLEKCWEHQVTAIEFSTIILNYKSDINHLSHAFDLWGTNHYKGCGTVYLNRDRYMQTDTLYSPKKQFFSKQVLDKNILLFQDYGETELMEVDSTTFYHKLISTSYYTPAYVLNYFYINRNLLDEKIEKESFIYTLNIGKSVISLSINKETGFVEKIVHLYNNVPDFGESLGDVTDVITYTGYSTYKHLFDYPRYIKVSKINGKVEDRIEVYNVSQHQVLPDLLKKPDNYKIKQPEILSDNSVIKKYNDHIYMIELPNESTMTMLVEFSDFFVALEAPKNSENGEIIIRKAKMISPEKPIRYFAAGHFHPHYLGGVRAFVHKGTTILSIRENEEYIRSMVESPYTLKPDSLQMENKSLLFEEVKKDSPYVITDGEYEIQLCFIGEQSAHTYDYLVFYFPKEKVLYNGDLVWIPQNGVKEKANSREIGIYKSIKNWKLDVETILQAWPINSTKVKSVIPFIELENAVNKN